MKPFVRIFIAWLPLAIAISGMSVLVYGTVQQNYRQSLNDPQIQMAEDAAVRLMNGSAPKDVVGALNPVDIANSLAPWVAVYDSDGVSLFSSGELNGDIPRVPQGVLTDARTSAGKDTDIAHENRVTWQPAAGVRQAIVAVYYDSPKGAGYVVAGRNMGEVEDREHRLSQTVFLAWAGTLIASFAAASFLAFVTNSRT